MRIPPILTEPGPESNDRAIGHLKTYFAGYTGRHFDTFAGGGARPEVANQITAEDLVTLPMLSVGFTGNAAVQILQTHAPRITELLTEIPTNIDMWDDKATASLARTGPAWQLWALLYSVEDFGSTKTSKLMARKRPRLVPVHDGVIKTALKVSRFKDSWEVWRTQLLTPDIRARLERWQHEADLDPQLSLLRVLDVVMWMEHYPEWKAARSRSLGELPAETAIAEE